MQQLRDRVVVDMTQLTKSSKYCCHMVIALLAILLLSVNIVAGAGAGVAHAVMGDGRPHLVPFFVCNGENRTAEEVSIGSLYEMQSGTMQQPASYLVGINTHDDGELKASESSSKHHLNLVSGAKDSLIAHFASFFPDFPFPDERFDALPLMSAHLFPEQVYFLLHDETANRFLAWLECDTMVGINSFTTSVSIP